MKTMNLSNLKCFLVVLWLIQFSTNVLASSSETTIDGYLIRKSVKEVDNIYVTKTATYVAKEKDCVLSWEVSFPAKEARESGDLFLQPTYPMDQQCNLPFKDQMPIHRAIYKSIFKDLGGQKFKRVFTHSFSLLDPSRGLCLEIARASIDSKEYKDYRKNYPNHKSGKHINSIFTEIINESNVYKELESLFNEHDLSITLEGVEKVFSNKVGKIKGYDKALYDLLVAWGIKDHQRILYDAGSFYFKIESK